MRRFQAIASEKSGGAWLNLKSPSDSQSRGRPRHLAFFDPSTRIALQGANFCGHGYFRAIRCPTLSSFRTTNWDWLLLVQNLLHLSMNASESEMMRAVSDARIRGG